MKNRKLSRRDFLRASMAAGTFAGMSALPAGLMSTSLAQTSLTYYRGWLSLEYEGPDPLSVGVPQSLLAAKTLLP